MRQAGKRGRLGARHFDSLKFIHEFAIQPFGAPTYPIDVSGALVDWQMLGNDQYGDCTFADETHYEMANAIRAGTFQLVVWPTAQQEIDAYLKYTHGKDVGAVIADLLLYWYKAGKILGFAPVDHTNVAEMDAAMQTFGGLFVGVSLTDDAEQLFNDNQAWTVANGQKPDSQEGHAILKVKAEGPQALDTYVTWGSLQNATTDWSKACIDEAWVIITTEDQTAKIDLQSLRADIEALGGQGGSQPGPKPVPVPTVGPIQKALQSVVKALETAVQEIKTVISEV